MDARIIYSRALIIVGLVAMLVGAIDPLEGCLIILLGIALVAAGALVGKNRYGTFLCWSLALVAIGVAVMFIFTWLGGLGGKTGRSMWWAILLLPYPAGWLMGVVGAGLALMNSWRRRATQETAIPG